MLRIVRRGDRHDARDLTVSIRFEGDFATAFREGRSDGLIPGETLKTFVHKTVCEHAGAEIEVLGLALCRRVLDPHRQIGRVRVDIAEQPWTRMDVGAKAQGQAFQRSHRPVPSRAAPSRWRCRQSPGGRPRRPHAAPA
jgi:urate oxidase